MRKGSNMKKILIYCPVFYPQNGGYSNAFFNFIKVLSELGSNVLEIDVITPQKLDNALELNLNNVNIIRIHDESFINFINYPKVIRFFFVISNFFIQPYFRYRQLKKILEQKKYDLILFETIEDVLLLFYLDLKYFKKIIIRIHATEETEGIVFKNKIISKIKFYFAKKVFNKVKYIISTNHYHLMFVKKFFFKENVFKIAEKSFFILPNTIFNQSKCFSEKKHNNKIKILTLGRMNTDGFLQKGFEDLLNALILLDDDVLSQLDITIIGDGEYKKYLQQKAYFNKLKITFISNISNNKVLELLYEQDVVILLSRFEGHSMFALEAMYTKNILLFTKEGGLKDMIEDSKNGFLVESQNIEQIAEKIKKIVLLNYNKREEMKEYSYKVFNKKFATDKIYNKFMKILRIIESDKNVTR